MSSFTVQSVPSVLWEVAARSGTEGDGLGRVCGNWGYRLGP